MTHGDNRFRAYWFEGICMQEDIRPDTRGFA